LMNIHSGGSTIEVKVASEWDVRKAVELSVGAGEGEAKSGPSPKSMPPPPTPGRAADDIYGGSFWQDTMPAEESSEFCRVPRFAARPARLSFRVSCFSVLSSQFSVLMLDGCCPGHPRRRGAPPRTTRPHLRCLVTTLPRPALPRPRLRQPTNQPHNVLSLSTGIPPACDALSPLSHGQPRVIYPRPL
jgi:hypothetical protein